LSSIFEKIKKSDRLEPKNIFSCAFGPGINIEMIRFSSVNTALLKKPIVEDHALEV